MKIKHKDIFIRSSFGGIFYCIGDVVKFEVQKYIIALRYQLFDQGRATRQDAASCLLLASQSAVQVALEAIQSLGGNGYINEYETGRLLRDAKLYEIGAGTSEIRRMLIGRELVEAREPAGA